MLMGIVVPGVIAMFLWPQFSEALGDGLFTKKSKAGTNDSFMQGVAYVSSLLEY